MKPALLFVFCGLLAISACKKSGSTEPLIDTDPLTTKPWKVAMVDNNTATNPKGGTVTYAAIGSCYQDDTYTFAGNGTLSINNGSTRCTVTEPDVSNLTYSIDKANNTITIDKSTYRLAEISATQFKYYTVFSSVSGVQYMVYIFQH